MFKVNNKHVTLVALLLTAQTLEQGLKYVQS